MNSLRVVMSSLPLNFAAACTVGCPGRAAVRASIAPSARAGKPATATQGRVVPLLRAFETELLDQRAPFQSLGLNVAAHALDRGRVVWDEADGRDFLLHLGVVHDLLHLGVQPLGDRP